MTARRGAALLLAAVAATLVGVALLTPLRASEIAALDAEAQELGEEWNRATVEDDGNLLSTNERAQELLEQSNEAYAAARALEPPLAPTQALGLALLAAAAGIAVWPTTGTGSPDTAGPADEDEAAHDAGVASGA